MEHPASALELLRLCYLKGETVLRQRHFELRLSGASSSVATAATTSSTSARPEP